MFVPDPWDIFNTYRSTPKVLRRPNLADTTQPPPIPAHFQTTNFLSGTVPVHKRTLTPVLITSDAIIPVERIQIKNRILTVLFLFEKALFVESLVC